MAQPNVAREPSMEEILASIRRIIESNEPGVDASLSGPMTLGYIEEEIEDPEEAGFVPELAANDPGLPVGGRSPADYAPEVRSAESVPSPDRALSLADVAARVRAASVRQQENSGARPINFPAPVQRQAEPAPEPIQPIAAALRPAIDPVAAPELRQAEAPRFTAMAKRPEAEQASREAPVFEDAPVAKAQGIPAKIEEAASILSAEAGAQVAKSFNELAAVFNGLEHRSVEEMAQELLRPMLQEWLDDNLPTLVERLVREEIERVARGPRR